MTFWPSWKSESSQREQLARWRANGVLDDPTWQRTRELTGRYPSAMAWRDFLEHLSLWLATALLAAAAICFIAANWDALGRFARLAGLQAALIATTFAAWRLGLERPAGQAALLLAGLLLGGLLALVGQTYQTGADTWQLFALWAVLLVPWTIAGASMPLGMVWCIVASIALQLYLTEHVRSETWPWLGVGLLNAALLALWQWIGTFAPGLHGSTGPRLLAALSLAPLTFGAVLAAMANMFGQRLLIGHEILAWAIAMAVVIASGWRWRRDLVLLALAALSLIVVDTAVAARLLYEFGDPGSGGLLLLALLVIGQASIASVLLRRLAAPEPHA